jgi:hypothetical protein
MWVLNQLLNLLQQALPEKLKGLKELTRFRGCCAADAGFEEEVTNERGGRFFNRPFQFSLCG